MVFDVAYIYVVNFIAKFRSGGKVVFLGGSMDPPLGTNESKSTLVTKVLSRH